MTTSVPFFQDVRASRSRVDAVWETVSGWLSAEFVEKLGRDIERDELGRFAESASDAAKEATASPGGPGAGWAQRFARARSGRSALDAVPARLTPGPKAHHGHYEGEKLAAPKGAGSVRALSQYEGVEYQSVNMFLRGHYRSQPGPGQLGPDSEHLTESRAPERGDLATTEIVPEIDKTMVVSRLPEDVVVERTFRHADKVFGRDVWYGGIVDWNTTDFDEQDRQIDEHWNKGERPDLTGLVFGDPGYTSTTVDPVITQAYADRYTRVNTPLEGEPVVLRILVPKGTGAVALSPMEKGSEAEILLQRGLTFEVVQDHGVDAGGVRRLDVVVVVPRG